jgi:hypothetical protein
MTLSVGWWELRSLIRQIRCSCGLAPGSWQLNRRRAAIEFPDSGYLSSAARMSGPGRWPLPGRYRYGSCRRCPRLRPPGGVSVAGSTGGAAADGAAPNPHVARRVSGAVVPAGGCAGHEVARLVGVHHHGALHIAVGHRDDGRGRRGGEHGSACGSARVLGHSGAGSSRGSSGAEPREARVRRVAMSGPLSQRGACCSKERR